MTVLAPADEVEVRQMIRAVAAVDGPIYVQITREPVPGHFRRQLPLRDRASRDGSRGTRMRRSSRPALSRPGSIEAAEILAGRGIEVGVLHIPTIKPLDEDALVQAAEDDRVRHHDRGTEHPRRSRGGRRRGPRRPLSRAGQAARHKGLLRRERPERLLARQVPAFGRHVSPRTWRRSSASARSGAGQQEVLQMRDRTDSVPVAIVTGSASGIGRAAAMRLAEDGYSVACLDLDQDGASATSRQISRLGGNGLAMKLDVSSESEVKATFSGVCAELGHLWALVHSAGILQVAPALDIGAEAWREVLEVNLTGTFLCDQAAARIMVAGSSGGRIVNIASVHSQAPARGLASYDASKGGIWMLTRNLALELAPNAITVNAIGPGLVVHTQARGRAFAGVHATRSCLRSRSGEPASRRTSPGRCRSCARGTPRTSQVRCCLSMVACC